VSKFSTEKRIIAIGPVMPGWGSWEWVGADLVQELAKYYRIRTFVPDEEIVCDVELRIKHPRAQQLLSYSAKETPIIYCPIDLYDGSDEIDADRIWLSRCSRILVHCERLRRYFEPYAPVEYIDHHVKFVSPKRARFKTTGYVLWVGVRANLDPVIAWINAHPLPDELLILTNLEIPYEIPTGEQLGFLPGRTIRVENWSPARHLKLLPSARAAIDIKGEDFRSRHKPPAKALDFLASGVPLAMNSGTAAHEHLARLGFDVATPIEPEHWLSEEYWQETQRFGAAIRELLSLERVGRRFRRIIDEVLAERR
jgi:hypothetical protein